VKGDKSRETYYCTKVSWFGLKWPVQDGPNIPQGRERRDEIYHDSREVAAGLSGNYHERRRAPALVEEDIRHTSFESVESNR